MEWWLALSIILGGLMILLATGMPVAFCFMVVNLLGVFFLWDGTSGFYQLTDSIYSSVSTFSLLPVPLFIIMGEVLFHSRLALKAIDVVDKWLGRIPGRLGVLALASGTMFSCLSGSSIGTTAMLGSIMIPDMEKRGYHPSISIGSCMCGALAMIIPPSALAVILAAIAGVSVGKVLIGGIVPGLLLAVLYIGYIVGRCIIQPSLAPSYAPEPVPLSEKMRITVKYLLPLGTIVFAVVGLIFLGIATPTESAAMGALATFILTACYGRLNMDLVKESLAGTLKITVMMFLIVTGSLAFSQILAYSGATSGFVEAVNGLPLPPLVLMIAMQAVILVLGMFMEQVSIMLITLPIFMPMVRALGFNEIWFALIMLVNLEVAMESPPFGFLLFVMKGVVPSHITMAVVYKSTLPFIIIDVSVILLMLFFPELVTWLPEHAL